MAHAKFNTEHKSTLDRLLLTIPGVRAGTVFGLPCFKVSAGIFATLHGDGVGIKLPPERVTELLKNPGFVPFQPFGRNRGQEFVQINHDKSDDYRHDLALFEESMRYVEAAATDQEENATGAQQLNADDTEGQFHALAEKLRHENSQVTSGKMMSSPGIQYRGKVFAFYNAGNMIFRLGRDFQPEAYSISQYSLLAPFKTKPPMLDWFQIPHTEQQHWEELARYALEQMANGSEN
jgi:hypothetical protein